MADENSLINERKKKLEELLGLGINPYPHNFEVTHKSAELRERYRTVEKGESTRRNESVAGRIRAIRDMGKVTFMDVEDSKGRMQLCLFESKLGRENYSLLKKVDIGDIFGADGEIIRTRSGELSINVDKYMILSKSIRPLPDERAGFKDPELRYRQRSVDLIMNPKVKEVLIKRTKIIEGVRDFLNRDGYLEVETPLLQPIYGGANARPFITELNALKIPMYLSISPELYLKRLIVGGIERVYTISKNFRNEGIDATHNPEFTMMECYATYQDYEDMMSLTENMYSSICEAVNGTTRVEYQGKMLEFKPPWKKVTMYDSVLENLGIEVEKMSLDDIKEEVMRRGYNSKINAGEYTNKGELVQKLFEEYSEKNLVSPTFVIDHPKETTPLCKTHRKNPDLIERFEPFVCGMEIGNAYSELNNPIIQRRLLEEQDRAKSLGNEEAHPFDEPFLEAIEYGMPPTGGLGLGIDRMVMLLTNQKSIRDVIYFPFMRPLV